MTTLPVTDLDKSGNIPQIRNVYLGPTLGWRRVDSPLFIEYVIDGGGSVIGPGYKAGLVIPSWAYAVSWNIFSNIQGSIVIDVWKLSQTAYLAPAGTGTPPTVANTITGSDLPTLTNAYAAQGTSLTGWTRNISQYDYMAFNINSCANIIRCTIVIECVTLKGQG